MKRMLKKSAARFMVLVMFVSAIAGAAPAVYAQDPPEAQTLQSPVIGTASDTGAEVTFYFDGSASGIPGKERIIVKGEFSGWNERELIKGEEDIWSYTSELPAGWYAYGLASYPGNTWHGDPLNTTIIKGGNPGVAVPGIVFDAPFEVLTGSTTTLTGVYFTGNEDDTEELDYSLAAPKDGVTISDDSLIVDETATAGTVDVIGESGGGKSVTRTIRIVDDLLSSPVINGDGTVTFNVVFDGPTLHLVGAMNGWDIDHAIPLTKTDGVFSVTIPLAAGVYEYKFVPNNGSWTGDVLDALNPLTSGGNSKAVVPGLILNNPSAIEQGAELPLTAKLQNINDTPATAVTPVWSLEQPVDGISIVGNSLVAAADAEAGGTVTVVAAYDGYMEKQVISIVEKMNTFTIHYYRFDGTANEWNLWLWPQGVNGQGYSFTDSTDEGYATGTYKFQQSEINVIPRLSVQDNDWSQQDSTRKVAVQSGNSVEAWIVEGISTVFYEKPVIDDLIPLQRKVRFQYIREDADYTDWNIWTWDTGKRNGTVLFTKFENGKAVADIAIGEQTKQMGFKLRKGFDWKTAVIDQNFDRVIVTGTEPLTKVIVTGGQGAFRTLPASSAPVFADGGATFYYRDDALFEAEEMHLIDGVKLKIGDSEYPMVYDAEDERFSYRLNALTEGTLIYTYLVTKDDVTTEVTDPRNTVDGVSTLTYKRPAVSMTSEVGPSTISYNENAVLKIALTAEEDTPMTGLYADLRAIGGNAVTFIDPQLNELTIAVKDTVTTGLKSIPITAIDIYGNKHVHTAKVRVATRKTVGGANDFDWDEARIYFMLTDRFFNGDPTNDDPNGENYNTSHLETYHGGDFKGITEKLGYLDELGINTIWITPIVDNIDFNKGVDFDGQQYGYHGYWAKDFTSIDEHLGELEDFKELIDAAHERGIKIMVDVVLNHTGYGLDALASGWSGLTNLPTAEEQQVFAGMLRDEDEDPVVRYSLAELPDLKTELAEVREQIIAWQTDWIEKSMTAKGNTIDYFRVDTVKHVENTTWMAFKNALTKIKPDFKLIGENFGASVNNDGGYLRSGMLDSELDFQFKVIARDFVDGRINSVEQELAQRDELIDNTATFGQFLSSHDEEGFLISLLSDEDRQKFREETLEPSTLAAVQAKQKIAASLQITAKGQPVIYYGEELGQSGVKAEDMGAGDVNENRYDLNWDGLDDPAYNHIFDHYKKMLNIRAQYSKVFSKGTRTQVAGNDETGFTLFERAYKGQSVYVGISTKTDEQQVTFSVPYKAGSTIQELYSGQPLVVAGDKTVTVTLPSILDGGTFVIAGPAKVSGDNSGVVPEAPVGSSVEVIAEVSGDAGLRTATVAADQLGAAIDAAARGEGKVQVHIPAVAAGEAADVRIPAAMLEKARAAGVDLQLVYEGMTITIAAGTLSAAELNGAEYAVISRSLLEETAEARLKSAIAAKDSGYAAISEIYSFGVKLVNKAGETAYVNGFGTDVQISITLSEEELALITNKLKTGVYYVKEDGALEFKGGTLTGSILTFSTDHFSEYVIMQYNKSFSDVKEGWAKAYIELLAARHITSGVDGDRFDPKGTVTRGQFAALLGRALGLKSAAAGGGKFSDMSDDTYYAGYVEELNKLGIIEGYEDGSFKPDAVISREQLAAMIIRAYNFVVGSASPAVSAGAAGFKFKDINEASPYAVASIEAAYKLGIINGVGDERFAPNAAATREQVAKMLIELLNKSGKLS
ncbi:alpha-amylase family glycosyl hydrolase [Paenibacillus sp. YIM B09110]|uniref:alpha-amylase family glycosyl hydrolase n=1 Tax=Paenibacillus sp. YIM B09110 TaxID=3126102 RepID=UPI00301DF40A